MKFYIKHSMTGRLRVHMDMKHMSFKQADILEYYIKNIETVTSVRGWSAPDSVSDNRFFSTQSMLRDRSDTMQSTFGS